MTKQTWIEIAQVIDHLRIFPRLVLLAYAAYVYNITFFVLHWYATQPKDARGIEESSVVGVVITAVTGFAPMIYRIYSDSGTDWSGKPPSITTSSSATTIATGAPPT
jgi:hypothetical protein